MSSTIKRTLAVCLAASVMAILPARQGQAAKEFTFHGAGWGHGLGMSQYGAYGLSLKGWGYRKILGHFYKGTSVGQAKSTPGKVRIGLIQAKQTIHVKAVGGPVRIRLGSPTGALVGLIPLGETWRVLIRNKQYKVLDASGNLVGGHRWGGPSENLFATYSGSGSKVYVSEAGNHYNRGHLEFNLYQGDGCPAGHCLRLVAVLSPQHYLYGLAEVPNSWPAGAHKAQAVAARTYAFEKVGRLGQHRPKCNCALFDDTWDQVYAGWDKEGAAQGSRWVDAVDRTKGEVVLYQGSPIQAYYHSSSGGHTEHNELAWGGTPLPYLRGVCDPGDYVESNPNRSWTVGPMSAASVTSKLRPYTGNIGTVSGFSHIERGVSGQILTARVEGGQGQATVTGSELMLGLGLKGDKFWVNSNRLVTGKIRDTYDNHMCRPGDATSSKVNVPGGARQRFEKGTIYANDARGRAYWLHGPVLDFYRARGGASGRLGLPTSGISRGPNGRLSATFERGAISCSQSGSCSQS